MNLLKQLAIYICENTNVLNKAIVGIKQSRYPKEKKKLFEKNAELKNSYCGKRCFIIGNGPSIKNMDLTHLKDEITFTVNQFPRSKQYSDLNPNFHMWADERFFDISEDRVEDMELLNVMKSVNLNDCCPKVFYKVAAKEMIEKFKLDQILDAYYFDDISVPGGSEKFDYIDFTQPVPRFSTVCHYLICLAVFLGFSQIILIGCDCTGFVTLASAYDSKNVDAQYAYEMTDNEKKRLQRSNFRCSIQSELKWYANIFDEYEKLLMYCASHNVQLLNASEGGTLTSLPRVHFEDLFSV